MIMRSGSHQPTVIGIVREAVEIWRKRERMSMAAVVQCIVETHERLGLDVTTEIRFESDRDAFRRMQTNAERVFRWLDDVSKHNNHLPVNFLQSVISALPIDLRVMVGNRILLPAQLAVHEIEGAAPEQSLAHGLQAVVKESSEAVSSVVALLDGATPAELAWSQQQLTESIAEQQAMLRTVEHMLSTSRG